MEINTKALAIVVTYNRIKDLKICVESLRNQSYHDLDILIINNGTKILIPSENHILSVYLGR